MASENETIADIVAQMRNPEGMGYTVGNTANGADISVDAAICVAIFADRLDAAWKRERVEIATTAAGQAVNLTNEKFANTPVGNAAAMREALEHLLHGEYRDRCEVTEIAHAALSAPPRNCDIYPTNEDAWRSYQLSHAKNADAYVEATVPDFIDWLFAPAEKGADA